MPAGTVLNRLNVPPLYANIEEWVWKKWLDDIYTEFFKNGQPRTIITTNNVTLGLEFFIPVDATTSALTVLLPKASDAKSKKYIIKKIDGTAHHVTVTPNGTDTIDGAATKVLANQYDAVFIESDGGSNWYVLLGSSGGGGGINGITVEDEGVVVGTAAGITTINFTGGPVTATGAGSLATVNIKSPLTTKGDIWGWDTGDNRIPVGTDGKVLMADSTNALGVSWQTVSAPAQQPLYVYFP